MKWQAQGPAILRNSWDTAGDISRRKTVIQKDTCIPNVHCSSAYNGSNLGINNRVGGNDSTLL